METKVIEINPSQPEPEKVKEAAQIVDNGGLVGFPTETVYGIACRVEKESLRRLDSVKGRGEGKYYTLHIAEKEDVGKYVPAMPLKAKRLVENVWPGPLTIVFELNDEEIEVQRKRMEWGVFEALYKNNSIGIRCCANEVARGFLGALSSAVVAPSANVTGNEPAIDAAGVLAQFNGKIGVLLDGGRCEYQKSSTVVKIDKGELNILREGVYSRIELEKVSQVQFLFVCTGNSCRSPMAEGMFRKYLSEKLGCGVDDLLKKGYKVMSAGTMGIVGFPASAAAVAVCANKGIDISNHRSSGLTCELIDRSGVVYAMSQEHLEQILALSRASADKVFLLAEGGNIADPMGRSDSVYESCGEVIEKAVKQRIDELRL